MDTLRLLFGVSGRVNRAQYLVAGVVLIVIKYALDAGAVYFTTGQFWTPIDYLNPVAVWRFDNLTGEPSWLMTAMLAWSLPFIWIGVSMTLRRASDAGLSPFIALLFFVPAVNWILLLTLATLPTSAKELRTRDVRQDASVIRSALLGILASVAITAVMIPMAVYGLGEYGAPLFLGTPFVQGVVTGHLLNRDRKYGVGLNLLVITLGVVVIGGAIVLFALEGAICVLMAAPLAWVAAVLGMFVGRGMAVASHRTGHSAAAILALPLVAVTDEPQPVEPYEVVSAIDIEAPPEVVWQHVVNVSDLAPPHRLVFEIGIAYPQRAVIEGEGVGAVRECEFSTGPFVEPIKVWDAPHRLAFDVTSQPAPMQEWSPYRGVHPPHLDGYFRSVRGEFRLIPTATGTRLEGSTWYELDIFPRAYWSLWSDALVGAIHQRVLEHIEQRAADDATL